MKFCVFFIFQVFPWIAWVGDWALRWTEGNEAVQITFVMFIFPVIMNAIQYYIIDTFIKEHDPNLGGHTLLPGEDEDEAQDVDAHRSRVDDGVDGYSSIGGSSTDTETNKKSGKGEAEVNSNGEVNKDRTEYDPHLGEEASKKHP